MSRFPDRRKFFLAGVNRLAPSNTIKINEAEAAIAFLLYGILFCERAALTPRQQSHQWFAHVRWIAKMLLDKCVRKNRQQIFSRHLVKMTADLKVAVFPIGTIISSNHETLISFPKDREPGA